MTERLSYCFAKYFRKAASAQSAAIVDIPSENVLYASLEQLLQGQLDADRASSLFPKNHKSASEQKDALPVIIAAKSLGVVIEDTAYRNHDLQSPTGILFIPASLDKCGALSPNVDNDSLKIPWIPRDYLAPSVKDSLVVGKSSTFDAFIHDNIKRIEQIEDTDDWDSYIRLTSDLYLEVTGAEFECILPEQSLNDTFVNLDPHVYVFEDTTVNATRAIIELYDHIIDKKMSEEIPLFESFVSIKKPDILSPIPNDLAAMTEHCGQMGRQFPLARSQRESLSHMSALGKGKILSVNGPPGTGKTTFLQSVVADLFVKHALRRDEPPVIVAASANNQAVTNIIESFGSVGSVALEGFEQRWLNGVDSFACYFPSNRKVEDAQKKGYHVTNSQGKHFVEDLEVQEKLESNRAYFLQRYCDACGGNSNDLPKCEETLHGALLALEKSKGELLSAVHKINEMTGRNSIIGYSSACQDRIKQGIQQQHDLMQILSGLKVHYANIPLLTRLLAFLPYFRKQLSSELGIFTGQYPGLFGTREPNYQDSVRALYENMRRLQTEIDSVKQDLYRISELHSSLLECMNGLRHQGIDLDGVIDENRPILMSDINDLVDTRIRFIEFWTAVHYYECRWLQEEWMPTEKQRGKTFENVLDKFYHRLCAITPCLVMTLYMLPRQFKYYLGNTEGCSHMFGFIDLLIIDEAGQVSPEIAACSFSLAKKAIVVGDVQQIPPVWATSRALDIALAIDSDVIHGEDDFSIIQDSGLNCSESSVMEVANNSCAFVINGNRGMFLSEHRRCYDEIVSYCNELVYGGNLEPMRGSGRDDKRAALKNWPQMGFRQISTTNSEQRGTSRVNNNEAYEIVEWIRCHFSDIQLAYHGVKSEDLLTVITPFNAQAFLIRMHLKQNAPEIEKFVTVGTVHTLQGAERRIVLMSTVYGNQDRCAFIDNNKNLMNVAVSRAKDHFFIFGDIGCLSSDRKTASGLLKSMVESNEI